MLELEFHELFRPSSGSDPMKKSSERSPKASKCKNRRKQSMSREMREIASGILRQMLDKNNSRPPVGSLSNSQSHPNQSNETPFIELKSNSSEFSVFAAIRQSVLQKQLKDSSLVFNSTFGRISNADNESEDESIDNKYKESVMKVPKVVGLGLSVAFELIRESRTCLPSLCIRALQALLNALQGQLPEGLKNEPSDVINPLFDLLLELVSSQSTYQESTESSQPSTSTSVSNNQTFVELKSYACSALLSLVTARGDTDKTLTAITALLTSPQLTLDNDAIETPNILISLQRSVHCVLLGKTKRPDWVTHGFCANALCDTFNVRIAADMSKYFKQSSLAFDGKYLYLYSGNQIHKIGSGYCGTVKGQVVHSNSIGSHKTQSGLIGWIGYVGDSLYLQTNNWTHNELIRLDKNSLKEVGKVTLGVPQLGPSVCASDNESLILITATKDDCFLISTLKPPNNPSSNSMSISQELTIKLSHKCLNVCGGIGSTIFEQPVVRNEQQSKQLLLRPIDAIEAEDIVQICCGKDFALIRTFSGKLYFTGKAQSLGIKQSAVTYGKWSELPITKSPKIDHISVGHDGSHALLVSEDGSVFFVGVAKRGEDGEQTKSRRQPKAGKPKKMIKMEGKSVEFCACNHGSSAIVTKNGELYLFGKDAHHVDRTTGLVNSLKNVIISQVAIGKAHILALTNKGHVYTFGISNKGQCGLDLMQTSTNKEIPNEDIDERGADQQIDVTEDITEPLCALGQHRWKYDQCMICTICGECTGYGTGCIASGKSERNPGMSCGCGAGDAGCADCGCCRACEAVPKEPFAANENIEPSMMPLNQMAFNAAQQLNYGDPINDEVQRFAAAFAMVDPGMAICPPMDRYGAANEVHVYEEPPFSRAAIRAALNPRTERRRIGIDILGRRLRHKTYRNLLGAGRAQDPMAENGGPHIELVDKAVSNVLNIDMSDAGSDGETSKLTQLPPTKLNISSRIIQIACGLHHSVLLNSSGDVFTFGSNQFGQLGHNDFAIREVPTKVLINANVIQIAAGSNHTVLLTSTGQVYTFGSNQKGQLGRNPSAIDFAWNAIPAPIPNIGQQFGRKATFISASGDHTFIKFDESLINPLSLSSARVIANRRCIAIIPSNNEKSGAAKDSRYESIERQFHSLVISRSDGTCKSFNTSDQLELSNFSAICLDNFYDVLWTYDSKSHSFNRYNLIYAETKIPNHSLALTSILLPELALPQKLGTPVNRSTAALNLLCTLDTLTTANQMGLSYSLSYSHLNVYLSKGWTIREDDQTKNQITKALTKDDYSSVCRFESHGGGWGFSSHSIEAIRFMADNDVLLGGFGLFGGRGEYTAKLKLFDIGSDGGEQEGDGEILAETDEIPFECAARQKYPILFDEPISLQANRWYVAWARISGPSSDCGSSGQSVVNTEDQVIFYFKSSKKSNNGTDVNAGQIPQMLYKVISSGSDSTSHVMNRNDYNSLYEEPICIIGREFSLSVNANCFQSLLKLLGWSWKSFKDILSDINTGNTEAGSALTTNLIELRHLTYICCASLHLLKVYINEIYPNRQTEPKAIAQTNDSLRLAECIYDVRTLLKHILSDPPDSPPRNHSFTGEVNTFISQIMDESHETFLSCYHSFYPNSSLRWRGLCDLLLNDHHLPPSRSIYLLSAMLAALCRPWLRLTQTFPIMNGLDVYNLQSPSDLQSPNSDLGTYQHSILSDKIQERTDAEGCHSGTECSFRDIFNNLLKIIGQPIRYYLELENSANASDEIENGFELENSYSIQLVENSCNLITTIMSELVAQVTGIGYDSQVMSGQQLHITPSRFSRVSQSRTWNTGNGSPDAICFSVDRPGISIAGVTVYGGIGNEWHYELDLLDYGGAQATEDRAVTRDQQSHPWRTIETAKGSYSFEDKSTDVCEIKFDRPVLIAPNVKYAIRLKNHGSRTNNGDAGLTHIRGPDNATFTFSDCSLSFNGTNHTRGQIPQILYYSAPQSFSSESNHFPINEEIPRKNAIAISESVIGLTIDLLLQAQDCASFDLIWKISTSLLIKKLLPSILAHLAPIASSDSKNATQILSMIRQLLPLVVYLNKSNDYTLPSRSLSPLPQTSPTITTSRHYVTVESDHPYKSATVCNYSVKFAPTVRWMCIDFDSRCATAQSEDTLQIYIPEYRQTKCWESSKAIQLQENNKTLWPILKKFSGKSNCWPTDSILIPGNELIFSLETASDYIKEDKSLYYGFRAQVIGYENPITEGQYLGLQYLEQELSYVSGICIKTLLKKNLVLPQMPSEAEVNYESALQVFETHPNLLSRGLALSHPMTASEAIEGTVPMANEHPFLKDFCSLTPGTSGARLAKWFQCESFVDPNQCEVHCSCGTDQELQCGWPTVITVITRDQYSNIVNVPNLKVEVSAQPFKSNTNTQSKQMNGESSSGGDLPVPHPPHNVQYTITAKDKVFYHAITMMRQFEYYSFEELRYVTPVCRPTIETMLVRSNNDGTYTANWTPGSTGWYQLKITVDGVAVNTCQSVQVGEPPKGVSLPQIQHMSNKANKKPLPSRTRKFVVRNSTGLRVRSLPSLQSEQIGVIEVNGVITITEESHNDDGVWVRLSPESIKKYCNTSTAQHNIEGWALQYNQHLGKTLLVPIGEPKPIVMNNGPTSESSHERKLSIDSMSLKNKKPKELSKRIEFPGYYHVVKCGVSGHNIRSKPHLRSPPVGMVVLGNIVGMVADTVNASGTWLRLDDESMKRYCFSTDGEAWTLSRTVNDVTYLQHETEVMHITDEEDNENKVFSNHKSVPKYNGLPSNPFSNVSLEERSSPSNSNACAMSPSIVLEKSLSSLRDQTSISQSFASESEVESIAADSVMASPSMFGNTFAEFEKTDIDSLCESLTNSTSSLTTTGSRVAALQKKFLIDSEVKVSSSVSKKSASSSPAREPPPELSGICVKELVKAMSCDPSPTPPTTPPLRRTPNTSRSSSPNVSIGSTRRHTTTAIPIRYSLNTSFSESNCDNGLNVSFDKEVSDSTDASNRKSCAQKATQTSPPEEGLLIPPHFLQFKINEDIKPIRTRPTPQTLSPNTSTLKSSRNGKESRNSRQNRLKRERIHSPTQTHNSNNQAIGANGRHMTVKEAISNSVAECLRAVFAAFIWHEGILHDTLAAASYLKFNPEVTKETVKSLESDPYSDTTVKFRHHNRCDSRGATREQKAKFRHSVEVSQLSALQQQECYLNANIEPNKVISETDVSQQEVSVTYEQNCEQVMSQSEESATDKLMIPETLVNLLKLWEAVSKCCLNAMADPPTSLTPSNLTAPSTPVQMFNRIQNNQRIVQMVSEEINKSRNKSTKQQYNELASNLVAKAYAPVHRFFGAVAQHGNLFGEAALANGGPHLEAREASHSSLCELCGSSYSYPVTHHMKKSHPGCAEHAGGKGYNSSGSFCGGWAGHCGDGGIGSSNWYLICDKCRDKYLAQKRHNRGQNSSKGGKHSVAELKPLPLNSPSKTNLSSPTNQLEIHQLMKENAMFLLRMAPANDIGPITNSFNPNRIRHSLEFSVRTTSFQCLENLGIHHSIYDQRLAEEHLSEDDIIAIQTGRPSNLLTNNEQFNANESSEQSSKSTNKTIGSRSPFHRSVSVGLHDWSQDRVVSMAQRKRAISNDNSSTTFLCQPSSNLINLLQTCVGDPLIAPVPTTSNGNDNQQQMTSNMLHRPIMAFILHPHDLYGLMIAMKTALRKASCRTLALHALNWLLRNVCQPMALHDLMWFFVDSLTPNEIKTKEKVETDDNAVNGVVSANAINAANNARSPVDRKDEIEVHYHSQTDVCQHPLADLGIAGEAAQPLSHAFHTFLSTVSDLMPLLPMGSPLQQIAIRCFCINFSPEDHSFLHQCHVFTNISKIFGRTEEETNGVYSSDDTQQSLLIQPVIESFQDLTPQMEIKASSRQAMIASLTDNSTETFWESGDEDRNKTKIITINNSNDVKDVIIKSVYIHIDNVRDLGAKTSHVTFKFGDSNALEPQLTKLKVSEVDNRFAGWLYCVIPYVESSLKCIKIELKGPDNTLRLRQIKVLGSSAAKSQDKPKPYISSVQIQQTNCEAETLRVFRLLTSQVFGKLISGEADSESVKNENCVNPSEPTVDGPSDAANDLREHMVGILFSQSGKLTHLQKQVCAHIVQAIRVEAVRQRDEWEALLCSKLTSVSISGEIPSDAYCFEMLSMVLALSGSSVGRQYLALQNDLLLDLFNLLHTGSARVQRQVCALLRRVLPEIKPSDFAKMFGIPSLPPRDIIVSNDKEEFDIHFVGILDVFLACIAKALTVQTKVKGSVGGTCNKSVTTITLATAIHPRDLLGDRWWLRGCLSRKLSECIIALLKDMSAGKLSDSWAVVTKNAIAQNVLNLTRINEKYRTPTECIKTPTLWIALASLCVLEQEHAERLSSSHWVNAGDQENGNQQSRPLCDNHDDGETPAIILCNSCGNLCAECDRYLHLHSKTRNHQRQIFKEEEEAIKVDLHEGCGRTKLFWVMALADSKTLKAMVEFRGENSRTKIIPTISGQKSVATNITGICRFCGSTGNTGLLAIGNVCSEAECQEYARNACNKVLSCGHQCGGVANEWKCLPCLQGCGGIQLKQDGEDMCMICFCEALSCAPAIQLKCGHVFHQHCTKAQLQNQWLGPRITFSFSLCPICKTPIEHSSLEDILLPIRTLFEDVHRKALMRLEYEGLHHNRVDAANYAMERYAYYVCSKCKKAYYGGEARCDAELGVGDNYDPSELVCGGCSDVSRAQMCPKHGTDFLEYKCRYCCSVAVFFCFGTTHFCNACHDDFQKLTSLKEFPKCPAGSRGKQLEGEECPLHVKHPPTGEEFALGCGVCRNAHTF